jgi:hypothetical protein
MASSLLVLTAATGVHSVCNTTCERDGRSPTSRARAARMRRAWRSAVRGCAPVWKYGKPVPVLELGPSQPDPDPQRLCRQYGQSRRVGLRQLTDALVSRPTRTAA